MLFLEQEHCRFSGLNLLSRMAAGKGTVAMIGRYGFARDAGGILRLYETAKLGDGYKPMKPGSPSIDVHFGHGSVLFMDCMASGADPASKVSVGVDASSIVRSASTVEGGHSEHL